ncbi:MAG: iron ABC transporter permease [Euryarchaeota archaeon]|jgi:iron complex transport system permease protein|uniref:Cobalamin import system permease protein BtuC n=1 Tax=Methanothrix harundinacea TaxID=301375 RepID=A0A124G2P2_9EURY|nr:MAG: ABC transporter, iron chelate uptake transporter family, permease protein [Methanothrix harundinacea]KUK94387.1 MAG: ABC transporter, iron chelate uptake transporter family, permease protein [Methanothrix harundinacea]MCP1391832.1 iron ABC transporter permease [Methanothrix harundinacea]MDI9398947.1 iron ABC transporter permease [Euryarchaeota archaeon]
MAKTVRRTTSRAGKRSEMQEAHDSFVFARYLFMAVIVASIIILTGVIITLGPLDITVADAYRALIARFYPGYFDVDPLTSRVVWNIRFPRIVGGILAGFGLGVCGCVMQAVLKNPLASPFTLGISSGAQFGISIAAVLGISLFGGPYLLVGNAFFFAILCSVFIIGLSAIKGATSETLILAGIAVNYFFSAMSQLFKYFADDEQLRLMTSWGMGDLAAFSWAKIPLILVVFGVCIPLLMLKAWDLNIMTSGDETAKSIGVDANRVRIYIMLVSSLVVATVVCFTGTIGFIGLVAPHMARMILGGDHRFLIPASGILGAVVLVAADGVAMNIIAPTVIPTGIMTSVIGVPFFMYLMLKGRRREFWA